MRDSCTTDASSSGSPELSRKTRFGVTSDEPAALSEQPWLSSVASYGGLPYGYLPLPPHATAKKPTTRIRARLFTFTAASVHRRRHTSRARARSAVSDVTYATTTASRLRVRESGAWSSVALTLRRTKWLARRGTRTGVE